MSDTKRVVAEVRFTEDRAGVSKVGGRSIHQYWTLLAPHFRDVFLPPQRRSDDGGVSWTWREPAEKAAFTPTDFQSVRDRLERAKESFNQNPVNPLMAEVRAGGLSSQEMIDQVAARVKAMAEGLSAKPDAALAEFMCHTDTGVMVHSWGLAAAAKMAMADAQDNGISGVVRVGGSLSEGNEVVLEDAKGLRVARTVSDGRGEFSFQRIKPGRYRLKVLSGPGRFPRKGTAVTVATGETARVEIQSTDDPLPSQTPDQPGSETSTTISPLAGRRSLRRWVVGVLILLVGGTGMVVWYYGFRRQGTSTMVETQHVSRMAPERFLNQPADQRDARVAGGEGGLGASADGVGEGTSGGGVALDRGTAEPLPGAADSRTPLAPRRLGSKIEIPQFAERTASTEEPGDFTEAAPSRRSGERDRAAQTAGKTGAKEQSVGAAAPAMAGQRAHHPDEALPESRPALAGAAPENDSQTTGGGRRSVPKAPTDGGGSSAAGEGGAADEQDLNETSPATGGERRPVQGTATHGAAAVPGREPLATGPRSSTAGPGSRGEAQGVESGISLSEKKGGGGESSRSGEAKKKGGGAQPGGLPANDSVVAEGENSGDGLSTSEGSDAGAAASVSSNSPTSATIPTKPGSASKGASQNDAPRETADEPVPPDPSSPANGLSKQAGRKTSSEPAAKPEATSEEEGAEETRTGAALADRNAQDGMGGKTSPLNRGKTPSAQQQAGAVNVRPQPAIAAGVSTSSLRKVGVLAVGMWKLRTGRDSIIPTQPVEENAADATNDIRRSLLAAQRKALPATLATPKIRYGFSVKPQAGAKVRSCHWRAAEGTDVILALREGSAEMEWRSDAAPRACRLVLEFDDGSEAGCVTFDAEGASTLELGSGLKASVWIAAEYAASEGPVSAGGPRYQWQVLKGPLAASAWFSDSNALGETACRLDMVLNGSMPGGTALALIDRETGWCLQTTLR